jgi:hypothetical protein
MSDFISNATLRCGTNINSKVPSRIVKTDLKNYGRTGTLKIKFSFKQINYDFEVPFTRPYTNKAQGIFANLLNLNQQRGLNNQAFEEFISSITHNYTVNPPIEIPCKID